MTPAEWVDELDDHGYDGDAGDAMLECRDCGEIYIGGLYAGCPKCLEALEP